MQDAQLAETQHSLIQIRPQHQQRQQQNQQFEGGENFVTTSIAKLDADTAESHRESRRKHLHLQLHNGKRVVVHGSLHHLSSGGDSVSRREIQKVDGVCGQDTHSQHTSVQCSLLTSAERIGRAWLKSCITFLCARKESVIWTGHVTLCCSLTCCTPRAHHLPHSLFLLPRH